MTRTACPRSRAARLVWVRHCRSMCRRAKVSQAAPRRLFVQGLAGRKASVVTDHIQTFTERGIALKSGRELEADIVVAATGLQLQMLGGIELRIDGKVKHLGERMTYRGVLLQDTPNFGPHET